MNIKLNYLYRDGANYKQHHEEIYTNIHVLSIEEIETRIREQLIDGEWFYNHNWNLEDLHRHQWDNEIDHTFHEFDSVEATDEQNTKEDILTLLQLIESKDKYSVL